jgi:hypothetical protein
LTRSAGARASGAPTRATSSHLRLACSRRRTNGRGKSCQDYSQWCDGRTFRVGASWAGGETFNFPEKNCCVCGGSGSAASPPPPPPSDGVAAHGYAIHLGFACRGADRTFRKGGAEECEAHCASRKCACAAFDSGVCRFTYTYTGLLRSAQGQSAFVRPGAVRAAAACRRAACRRCVAGARARLSC